MVSFDELIRNLLLSGTSEADIVLQLEGALSDPSARSALADDLETVKEWAIHAGWEPSEIDRAFVTLSEVYYARFRAPET